MSFINGWFVRKQDNPLIQAGLFHYRIEGQAEKSRVHLRLDPDGHGTLIVNANRIMHLNPTAADGSSRARKNSRGGSFYVFHLPFLKYLYSWLMTVLVLTTRATGGVYFMRGSFQFIPPQTVRVSPSARKHLTFLVAFLFFLGTLGAWIALNEVLYSKRGVVFGPGYTDVNTQVGMFKLLMGATMFCGITILAFAFRRDWRIPAAGLAVFFAVLVVGTGIYPSLVQKLKVTPTRSPWRKPTWKRTSSTPTWPMGWIT